MSRRSSKPSAPSAPAKTTEQVAPETAAATETQAPKAETAPKETTQVAETAPKETAPKEQPTKASDNALVRDLQAYVDAMAPNQPLTASEGVRHQKRLHAIIVNALTLPESDKEASDNFITIMDFIAADNSGVFKDHLVFRFYDSTEWKVPRIRKEAETLVTIATNCAPKKGRAEKARSFSWDAIAKYIDPTRAEVVLSRLRATFGID